jgi:hypothetical protein
MTAGVGVRVGVAAADVATAGVLEQSDELSETWYAERRPEYRRPAAAASTSTVRLATMP